MKGVNVPIKRFNDQKLGVTVGDTAGKVGVLGNTVFQVEVINEISS